MSTVQCVKDLEIKPIMVICWLLSLATLIGCLAKDSLGPAVTPSKEHIDSIVRLDPAMDDLIPVGTVIEKVVGGFEFTEGPVWLPSADNRLFFSDIPGNKLYSWSATSGLTTVLDPVVEPEHATSSHMIGSNGLAISPAGKLILCEHGNRRVSQLELNGDRTTLASHYLGQRLNSPNDIVFHSSGAAFFTDPPYGLEHGDQDPVKELTHNSVYRLDPNGTLTRLTSAQSRPNGLAFSPDERTLFVSNSGWPEDALLMRYPVLDDLSLGEGSLFFDTAPLIGQKYTGTPDGLKLDQSGNIYTTGPGGILILDPEGRHLGTIKTDEVAANLGWGDDGSTLYITANTSLYKIKTHAVGLNYRKK